MGAAHRGRGNGKAEPRLGVLVLLFLLLLAVREALLPAAHPPLPHPSPAPPFLGGRFGAGPPQAALPSLDQLIRRHVGPGYVLEVIYANPLLPSDEAANPVFRIVAVFRETPAKPRPELASGSPTDPGFQAQLRTSDGRLHENLVWQEEIRHRDRVLGYLSCRPGSTGEGRPLLTRDTQWVELSLAGLDEQPVRFRWTLGSTQAKRP